MRINRTSKPTILEAMKKMEQAMGMDSRDNCVMCGAQPRHRYIFNLPEGKLCLQCLPDDLKGAQAQQREAEYQAHLEAERNKPKPEGYGEWA